VLEQLLLLALLVGDLGGVLRPGRRVVGFGHRRQSRPTTNVAACAVIPFTP
jgi:hypothetical protein